MPIGTRPLTPDVAEVKMEFTQDGQYLYNTHHFYDDAGWDEGRLNNLGLAVKNWWDSELKAHVVNAVKLTAITVRDLTAVPALEIAVTTGLPLTGGNVDEGVPNNVTTAVKKATGLAGRAFRGRTYHVGTANGQVNSNTVTAFHVGVLTAAYNALRNPGSGLFVPQMCVLSEVVGGAWRGTGIATIVTGIAVDATVDSQRRRLPGRGR